MTRPSLAALERFPPPRSWYKFAKKTNYQAKHFRPVLRRGWNVDFCSSLRHSGLLLIQVYPEKVFFVELSLSPCFTRQGLKCIPMPSQISPIWKLYKIEYRAGAYAVLAYFVLCPEYPRGNQRHFESQSFLAADDVGEEIPSQKQKQNAQRHKCWNKEEQSIWIYPEIAVFSMGEIYLSLTAQLSWKFHHHLHHHLSIYHLFIIYISSAMVIINLNLSLHDRMLFCNIIFFGCIK